MSISTEESGVQQQQQQRELHLKIATIFDEVRSSQALHSRKLKELAALRSSSASVTEFSSAFCKALTPLFNFQRRTASAERIVKFASIFVCLRNAKSDNFSDELLENFLEFLLVAAAAANKSARFRACEIISEIIMRLPDDAEVSNELWDEVIECMKVRVGDKVAAVRTFAVRALLRFANDSENADILKLFLEKLPLEQNPDVRKAIVLSLPPSGKTLSVIIDCTLDVNESVRKSAYCVLASKFPLQSLSIKFRTTILQRGLADRATAVTKECLKLMKDEWLEKCCNGDAIELLKFLDVETYESVGELVMETLLKADLVTFEDGRSIRKFFVDGDAAEGQHLVKLMDAETALFWRMVCKHLQAEANTKGSDAAKTMGTESAVYAEEASDKNDLLESILPASISDFVELVKAHIAAGPNYRFVSRQLLLLGAILDFSDASIRKVASEFLQHLLHMPLDHELDDDGNEVVIGDGFNLGGEKDWAAAVAELAKKVHASSGEFEEVVLAVVEELAQPCRERTADCKQWLHCLSVTALLLENVTSSRHMQGRAMDPTEILQSLLLPGAKHAHLDVQRSAVRCLGLFGLLERKPSENLVKQLRCSFIKGPSTISFMASKALLDLGMWHGLAEMDKSMNCNLSSQLGDHELSVEQVEFCNGSEDSDIQLLDLLYAGLEYDWDAYIDVEEHQSIQEIIGQGFAKILLLSKKIPGLHAASTNHLLLAKLISLYFSGDGEQIQRLKQCLSVFFEHYPSLSPNHKKCLSKAFIPVMHSLWPGINGNATGSTAMVSNLRKRATQASRFMLQMMQAPIYGKDSTNAADNTTENKDCETDPFLDFESGEEGLALRIAVEVASFNDVKKTAVVKSFLSALCKTLVLFNFRSSEQGAVKIMRILLNRVSLSVPSEKEVLKELKQMSETLQAIDMHPDQKLSPDQANQILERLELKVNLEEVECNVVPPTPLPQSTTRRTRVRRKARAEESSSSSDENQSPNSVVPNISAVVMSTRSQRASKTAALTKITTKTTFRIDEEDIVESEDDENGSELSSEDDESE